MGGGGGGVGSVKLASKFTHTPYQQPFNLWKWGWMCWLSGGMRGRVVAKRGS